jgi:hypothetical protein
MVSKTGTNPAPIGGEYRNWLGNVKTRFRQVQLKAVASHELGPTFGGSDPTNLDPPLWV